MDEAFLRTEMLLGASAMEKLTHSHVAVLGLGGVGSWCAEALARSGVGELTLADCDKVGRSNLNRQLVATTASLGQPKAQAMAERVSLIAPTCKVHSLVYRYIPEDREIFFAGRYDYIVDAIDLQAGPYRDGSQPQGPHHLRLGNRQQTGSLPVSDLRHFQNPRLPAGPGGTEGTAKSRDQPPPRPLVR